MDINPIAKPLEAALPALEGSDDVGVRRCGRCRRVFEDDPTLDVQGRNDWALCPSCEAILLPRRARGAAHLTLVPPVDGAES